MIGGEEEKMKQVQSGLTFMWNWWLCLWSRSHGDMPEREVWGQQGDDGNTSAQTKLAERVQTQNKPCTWESLDWT